LKAIQTFSNKRIIARKASLRFKTLLLETIIT